MSNPTSWTPDPEQADAIDAEIALRALRELTWTDSWLTPAERKGAER